MTLSPKSHSIDKFGDRIEWLILNFEADRRIAEGIKSKAALRSKLIEILGEVDGGSQSSWKRWMRGDSPVPEHVVQSIIKIYPELSLQAWTVPNYKDFLEYAQPFVNARKRWTAAISHLRTNRNSLASVGKRYHAEVDEEPDFPLIARRGWLLHQPILITSKSPLPRRDLYVREDDPPRLQGARKQTNSWFNSAARKLLKTKT